MTAKNNLKENATGTLRFRSNPFRSPSPNTEYAEKGSARLFPKFAFLYLVVI